MALWHHAINILGSLKSNVDNHTCDLFTNRDVLGILLKEISLNRATTLYSNIVSGDEAWELD